MSASCLSSRAGLPSVDAATLRSACAHWLRSQGLSDHEVAAVLGLARVRSVDRLLQRHTALDAQRTVREILALDRSGLDPSLPARTSPLPLAHAPDHRTAQVAPTPSCSSSTPGPLASDSSAVRASSLLFSMLSRCHMSAISTTEHDRSASAVALRHFALPVTSLRMLLVLVNNVCCTALARPSPKPESTVRRPSGNRTRTFGVAAVLVGGGGLTLARTTMRVRYGRPLRRAEQGREVHQFIRTE